MAYTIDITRRAMADIRAAATWLSRRSPRAAARLQASLIAAVRSLGENPQRCPLAEEAAELGMELRRLLHGKRRNTYRILFTIEGETVLIHRVRHASQDWLAPDDLY